MEYEWDEDKNQATSAKRNLSFDYARFAFDDPDSITELDERVDYGETRYRTYGKIDGVLHVVAHTPRGEGATRIISARLANRAERRDFERKQNEEPGNG